MVVGEECKAWLKWKCDGENKGRGKGRKLNWCILHTNFRVHNRLDGEVRERERDRCIFAMERAAREHAVAFEGAECVVKT